MWHMDFKQRRIAAGMSVSSMANSFGVSTSTIRRWEAGKVSIKRVFSKTLDSLPPIQQIEYARWLLSDDAKNIFESKGVMSERLTNAIENLRRVVVAKDSKPVEVA